MSVYDGLAEALRALAAGGAGDAAWLCVERASRIATAARVRAMGCPSNTTAEEVAATVFGRLVDRAVMGLLPTFDGDTAAGAYFASTARSVIVDAARRKARDARIEAELEAVTPANTPPDEASFFDADDVLESGRVSYWRMVDMLRASRRAQDRPSLDRAAASLDRIAFEGMALEDVLKADGEWSEEPGEQQRARDRRYQAHKRLRDQLVELAGKPEAASVLAPWSGAVAQAFLARWLIRCQVHAASASSPRGAFP